MQKLLEFEIFLHFEEVILFFKKLKSKQTNKKQDPPMKDIYETTDTTFQHAIDLVRFIKKNFGDYFSIAVAG